ncbi:hypothetical protein, partial [Escherichia coli]|uniref:hypothetical protein n=1 Tax=Escherichia coli TaxID=562 RepID=UPI003D9C482C
LARPQNNNFHDEMVEQYGRAKRFLPAVLRGLHFRAAPADEHILATIHYLTELNFSELVVIWENTPPIPIIHIFDSSGHETGWINTPPPI